MAADSRNDWRKLCEAAAKETDPDKFLALIVELNNALDERDVRSNNVPEDVQDLIPRSSASECAW
jgi:hypothetical protein